LKFTVYHGVAVSLALHSLLALPFVVYSLAAPTDASEVLVMDLQGIASDTQTEQKVLETSKGSESQEEAGQEKRTETPPPQAKPSEDHSTSVAENGDESPPAPVTPPSPATQQSVPKAETQAGAKTTKKGVDDQQDAETIKANPDRDTDRLWDYAKALSKSVQAHLVYPDKGRSAGLHGTTTISFTVLVNGQIRPESLKIVVSSGQAPLDAAALKTIRASIPFNPPPKEMTVAIAVAFARKR
jgi:periplasmic protein TonB